MNDFQPLLVDDKDGRALYLIYIRECTGFTAQFQVARATAWDEENDVLEYDFVCSGDVGASGGMFIDFECDPYRNTHQLKGFDEVDAMGLAIKAAYTACIQSIPNFDHGITVQ